MCLGSFSTWPCLEGTICGDISRVHQKRSTNDQLFPGHHEESVLDEAKVWRSNKDHAHWKLTASDCTGLVKTEFPLPQTNSLFFLSEISGEKFSFQCVDPPYVLFGTTLIPMNLSLDTILTNARELVSRLRRDDSIADTAVNQAQYVQERILSMKQVRRSHSILRC